MAPGPTWATALTLGLVGLATSPSPSGTLLALAVVALVPLAGLWSTLATPRDGGLIAWGLAIGIALHVGIAVATGEDLPFAGATAHPNVLGALAAVALPALIVASSLERRRVWVTHSALAIVVIALAASGSRGALVAALVGAAWPLVARQRRRRGPGARGPFPWRRAFGLLVVFAAVAGGWWSVRQPSVTEAFSTTGRGTLWGIAVEAILERPVFGHGALAWSRVVPMLEPSIDPARFPHAHSGYLELALAFGVVGLVVVVAYGLAVVRAVGGVGTGVWGVVATATWLAFALVNVGDAFVLDARFLGIVFLVSGVAWTSAEGPSARAQHDRA